MKADQKTNYLYRVRDAGAVHLRKITHTHTLFRLQFQKTHEKHEKSGQQKAPDASKLSTKCGKRRDGIEAMRAQQQRSA